MDADDSELAATVAMNQSSSSSEPTEAIRQFKKVLVANRGEIAIRIYRALSEMEIRSVGIYSEADTMQMHRTLADESYMIGKGLQPVQAYLSIPHIIRVAKETQADAVHPGYGFLSESAEFAQACRDAGIVFIGPRPETVKLLGDKVMARQAAAQAGVPMVPGSQGPLAGPADAAEFCRTHGLPIILKAACGGGGRGMRIVREAAGVADAFERAASEASAAFGNGALFAERYVESARHIEVQILADKGGAVVHLFERDCSVQRRHQKVLEMAPAHLLSPKARAAILEDAVKLTRRVGYENAGTVEFLYEEASGKHYFMEVNPRVQVEHTVTEEITGIDIVRTQIRLAEGHSLSSLGLTQGGIAASGFALQCRVTAEDPGRDFRPDSGRIEYFQPGLGPGVRMDSASAFAGAIISPHYDSLLCKVITHAGNFDECIAKMRRALKEMRILGVDTNISFLENVLACDEFRTSAVNTAFLERNPQLMRQTASKGRAQKLLKFIAETLVNGPQTPVPNRHLRIPEVIPEPPNIDYSAEPPDGWRKLLLQRGPEGFARAILEHKGILITDTTMRDAHQSLLATRVRTHDLLKIAPFVARRLPGLLSLECWGGATFDVALRFLRECPWRRLQELRKLIPNVPFQMLLRGANAVGYTNYPDNVVYKFCEQAVKSGVDIFRVFDCLNYVPNMLVGMDAARKAGGVVEAAICYTGDVLTSKKYTMEYYLDTAEQLVRAGTHLLAIKDMAGLLKPEAASLLVALLKRKFPHQPLAVHTHDTAGAGVAALLACAEAGADIVDCAVDAMSGITSQPSMGAVVSCAARSPGLRLEDVGQYGSYWELARRLYVNFECTNTMRSGNADVYDNQIPGGQYTNLQFQSISLGLADQFAEVKKKFAEANDLLGDIIKVTPSSKVVGDLAQFMVQNRLSKQDVLSRAAELSFPSSVVQFFEGSIGQPPGGFPTGLASAVLRGRGPKYTGRPGAELPPLDFDQLRRQLEEKFGGANDIADHDVVSAALYPQLFDEFAEFRRRFGDVAKLSTRVFFQGPQLAEEMQLCLGPGTDTFVKSLAVTEPDKLGQRRCFFEVNGQLRVLHVQDTEVSKDLVIRRKANPGARGELGAPMPGQVLSVATKPGDRVQKGQSLMVLSAMKMELVVTAVMAGSVKTVWVAAGDRVEGGDLLVTVE